MITAGAIPALDLYRNQPVVGGYGTHDLDPNRVIQTKWGDIITTKFVPFSHDVYNKSAIFT